MPIQRVHSHPNVKADRGRVALQRGPVVYCLEGIDNGDFPRQLTLPPQSALRAEFRPDLLGGITIVRADAVRCVKSSNPDQPVKTSAVQLLAIPYYAWDNRAAGEMVVWLPEGVE